MTKQLYLDDAYLKECAATVQSVEEGKYVVLDQTVFYAQGGGQPSDTGVLVSGEREYKVVLVRKTDGKIVHEVEDCTLNPGDQVTCKIDWDQRLVFMRMHTACHLVASIFHNKLGALISGNQIGTEKTRIDFTLEDFDREKIDEMVALANTVIQKDLPVKVYYKDREEAMEIPGIIKLAKALPPEIKTLRIVEIEGADTQADGGTHVNSLKEIGTIKILELKNKGKSNRRLYFALE